MSTPGAGNGPILSAEKIEALHERYEVERAKRLRADGNSQFRQMEGALSHFADDPNANPNFTRPSIQRSAQVVIVGAGLSGLVTAVALRKQGIDDIVIMDKAADFGGTWYWNRYPGVACDVESYIYMPLLEEVGDFPADRYASGMDILRHFRALAEKFGLYDRSFFQTALSELRWDNDSLSWLVTTDRGDRISARFVVSAGGLLQKPKLPGIPGIEEFQGHSFHTSRWDYKYTGGDQFGGLAGLSDKRVGIVGTGATAIQCVPILAECAEHLYVFQRTPSSVFLRDHRKTDQEWAKSLKPGWQKQRIENFSAVLAGFREEQDIVADGWSHRVFGPTMLTDPALAQLGESDRAQYALIRHMEECRALVGSIVKDTAVAESLKAWYPYFCKRPAFHDNYLNTFNRPNVSLVDTKGKGIERITANSAIVQGVEYSLDCLIYSTGFEFTGDDKRRLGAETYGRRGVALSHKFAKGASTFQGLHTHGFPNLFRISTVQTGTTFNYTHIATEIADHIAYLVRTCIDRKIRAIEATEESESAWVNTIVTLGKPLQQFLNACTPSYLNREGNMGEAELRNLAYGDFSGGPKYIELLAKWRQQGDLEGLAKIPELSP
jgi:cyclohexanone monooxygenase